MSKTHLLLNAGIIGSSTAYLTVIEFDGTDKPSKFFDIAEFSEDYDDETIDTSLKTDFTYFSEIKEKFTATGDVLDDYYAIKALVEEHCYQNNKAFLYEVDCTEIAKHLNQKHNSNLDMYDCLESKHIKEFVKDNFTLATLRENLEERRAQQMKKSPFGQVLLQMEAKK